MTCEEKVKFHETVILLTLHAASIDVETFNLENIATLVHFIYFNTNDDRIFEFFNITINAIAYNIIYRTVNNRLESSTT